jgi:hypothetical protein
MIQTGRQPSVKFNIRGPLTVEFIDASARLSDACRERLAPTLTQETAGPHG